MGIYSRHIFPRVLEWSLNTAEVVRQRRRALERARGRVLEIGFGTGLNLPHYPDSVESLTILDQESMLPARVDKRIATAHIPVEKHIMDASDRLPFEEGSFDSVTSTFTLCTIRELAAALAGIKRVLRPDGLFLFLEHGRSDDPKVARRQDRYNPIHKFLALGCNVNRPIGHLVEAAGFEVVDLERFLMPDAPRVVGEMYMGVARKRQEARPTPGP
jgi:ubiquinone/menaquinone biosynthesis C-methylase UbiE